MGEPVFTSCRRKVKDRRLVASSRLLLYRIAEPGYGSDILIPRIYEFLYEFLYVCFSVAKLLSYRGLELTSMVSNAQHLQWESITMCCCSINKIKCRSMFCANLVKEQDVSCTNSRRAYFQ